MNKPLVSIIMPVYNAESYIKEAIQSILNQTFTDFEFIIIDDGSTDNSLKIIKSFKDNRIKIIKNKGNLGLIKTLNKGINLAQGRYIARMDADDIAMPERLEKQMAFLKENPDYGLVGTLAEIIDEEGVSTGKIHDLPISYEAIKSRILFQCPFVHPSVMGKIEVFKEFKYKENYPIAEDLFLWIEIISKYKVANINELLLKYRVHSKNVSSDSKKFKQKENSLLKIFEYQLHLLDNNISHDKIKIHFDLYSMNAYNRKKTIADYGLVYSWITDLANYNEKKKWFNYDLFIEDLASSWYKFTMRNAQYTLLRGYLFYLRTPLSKRVSNKKNVALLIHSIGNYKRIKPSYYFFKQNFIKLFKLKI
jgi:glycosyltransferase involved in cell wall biosynthesis